MNNPELRDVLTEAQRASILSRAAAALQEAEHQSGGGFLGYRALAEAALDVTLDALASLPGVAVIQLPEPNSTRYEDDEFPPADRLAWWCPGSLFGISQWGYPNEVQIAYNGEPFEPVNIIEARFIAAALLAAAAAAEVSGE
ncbi:hypothetical protein SEA_ARCUSANGELUS_83 [Mycobacterium phage ArcusAngelus]|uniref:Uncharacterized protein n=1 Tax=Mycobacterium phage ArcusAngelus TaxID=2315613 RepID=A0A386KT75_9CAUD|nr:hypothetical protein I5H13_gp082 [Mycobacterium phage ArcusAngelus]AYD87831.1 hypothetical protein SEA_ARCUSANGELUS_83 [Mycobacterium phage ArcusAngelus]